MAETLESREEQAATEIALDEKISDEKEPTVNGDHIEDCEDQEGKQEKKDKSPGEEEEEELGLLEKPVEILSRKRERKSTERFSLNTSTEVKPRPEDELDYTQGCGTKLGDIPFIKHSLDKILSDDLKPLHKLLYNKITKSVMVKKNIRAFCGYPFDKDSPHYKKVLNVLDRFVVNGLKFICGTLGLERGGDREKLKERLLEFLMEPKDLGRSIPQAKKSKSSKSKPKKKKSKSDEKKSKSKIGDDDISSASDDSDDEEKDKKPKSAEKKKKKTESPKKKSDSKKKQPTTIKIAAPKKKTKTDKPKTEKRKTINDSDDDDDEPLVKKTKSEPTDLEIKNVVSDILKDADLEQVTMKTVCRQVYDHFPDFDMTVRKDFIKTTVKEIIS